jgi:hypothetical protein
VRSKSSLHAKLHPAHVSFGVLCVAVLGVAFAQPTTNDATSRKMTDTQIVQDLRARLNRLAAEDKFSGAVLLAKGDKILFERAYGFADHAFNARNQVDTKFNLASMGKMFTAVAVLQLVEQGKLSLEAKLSDVLPEYPDKNIASRVTIYQLLTTHLWTGRPVQREVLEYAQKSALYAAGFFASVCWQAPAVRAGREMAIQQRRLPRSGAGDREGFWRELSRLRTRTHLQACRHDQHGQLQAA